MTNLRLLPLLLVLGIVSACSPAEDGDGYGWKMTADGLKCSGADVVTPDGTCVWYCRDFSHQKNADLTISHNGEHLQMQIRPSDNC